MEITICYIIIYLLEAFILWQYCSNLFFPRHSKLINYTLLLASYTVLFLISFLEIFWINFIAFFIVNFLLIFISYQTKCNSALFHASIITIVMGFSELVILNIISHFASGFYAERSHFRNLVILTVFSKLIYFFILHFIIYLLGETKEKDIQHDKGSILLTVTPVISVCVMITFFSICLNTKLSLSIDWMISGSSILMLVLNLLIFWIYNYNQKKMQDFTEMQLQLQKEYDSVEYYKMLLKQDENQNILIHDIKKHLQSIALLNEHGEQKKITAYIDRIIHSSDLKNSAHVCDNELLNAILCRYMRSCSEQRISFRTDIRGGSVDFLAEDDLTSLFSNLLDNASEAASKLSQSFIELNVACKANTNFTVLTMINSCRKNPFSEKTGKLITGKQDKLRHGFGMKSIKRIVKKYNGDIQVYYDCENKLFHTIITLKNA